MKKLYFLLCFTFAFSLNIFSQAEAVHDITSPREVVITVKDKKLVDNTKLRVVVNKKTSEGNVEIQDDSNFVTSLDGKNTIIKAKLIEDLNPSESYTVTISGFKIQTSGDVKTISFDTFKVAEPITRKLSFNPIACKGGIQLRISLPNEKSYEKKATEIIEWINQFKSTPSEIATLEIAQGLSKWTQYKISFVKEAKVAPLDGADFKLITTCFELSEDLFGVYDIRLNFNQSKNPPDILAKEIKVENFGEKPKETAAIKPNEAFVRKGDPGERSRDSNFEAGLTFTNSKDTDTKKRSSHGILDLQITPINNKPFIFTKGNHSFDKDSRNIPEWFGYWTPIFLDANVSTDKITKSTLSLNRIAIGGGVELRYVPVRYKNSEPILSRFPTYHTFNLEYKHYSDRDFKQNEFVGSFSYSPVLGFLNHPRKMNFTYQDRRSNGKEVKVPGIIGYKFVPSFGVEFGRTYLRRNPATAIEPSETVKRLFAKFDGKYEYGRFGFGLSEELYYRGESSSNRVRNYLELDFESFLNDLSPKFKHALFLNYKLGSSPPFDSTVDALTIGYRIRFSQ